MKRRRKSPLSSRPGEEPQDSFASAAFVESPALIKQRGDATFQGLIAICNELGRTSAGARLKKPGRTEEKEMECGDTDSKASCGRVDFVFAGGVFV